MYGWSPRFLVLACDTHLYRSPVHALEHFRSRTYIPYRRAIGGTGGIAHDEGGIGHDDDVSRYLPYRMWIGGVGGVAHDDGGNADDADDSDDDIPDLEEMSSMERVD